MIADRLASICRPAGTEAWYIEIGMEKLRMAMNRERHLITPCPSPAPRERVANKASRGEGLSSDGCRVDPHAPSPPGRVPPSPAVRARGFYSVDSSLVLTTSSATDA